jgi:hypothetical protein
LDNNYNPIGIIPDGVIVKLPLDMQKKIGSRFGVYNGGWHPHNCSQQEQALVSYSIKYDTFMPYTNVVNTKPAKPTLGDYIHVVDDSDASSIDEQALDYRCRVCNVVVSGVKAWEQHKVSPRHNKKKNPPLVECEICSAKCANQDQLKQHMLKHAGRTTTRNNTQSSSTQNGVHNEQRASNNTVATIIAELDDKFKNRYTDDDQGMRTLSEYNREPPIMPNGSRSEKIKELEQHIDEITREYNDIAINNQSATTPKTDEEWNELVLRLTETVKKRNPGLTPLQIAQKVGEKLRNHDFTDEMWMGKVRPKSPNYAMDDGTDTWPPPSVKPNTRKDQGFQVGCLHHVEQPLEVKIVVYQMNVKILAIFSTLRRLLKNIDRIFNIITLTLGVPVMILEIALMKLVQLLPMKQLRMMLTKIIGNHYTSCLINIINVPWRMMLISLITNITNKLMLMILILAWMELTYQFYAVSPMKNANALQIMLRYIMHLKGLILQPYELSKLILYVIPSKYRVMGLNFMITSLSQIFSQFLTKLLINV